MAKTRITVTPRADKVKTDLAAVARDNPALARRLQSGNVHGGGNRDIPLKEPARWQTYLANTYANDNAFFEMRELGWIPLTADDLSCTVQEAGFRLSPDNYIVRGPQGQEMLWKMDKQHYRLLEQARTAANLKGIGSAKKIKADMAEAASSQMGGEAADYIAGLDGSVVDSLAD